MSESHKPRVAYLTVGYPTLSQTFIQREVEGLANNGIDVTVFPCRQIGFPHQVNTIEARPLSPMFPFRVVESILSILLFKPIILFECGHQLLKYKWKSFENLFASICGVISGLAMVGEIKRLNIGLVHAAWATLPATAAAVAARIAGVPFSFGAHAYDVYRNGGDGFLLNKLNAAAFVHTTTQANVDYLSRLVPEANIVLARRGLQTLPTIKADWFLHDEIRILSVGRLVKKKGYFHQLAALHELKRLKISIRLKIIGDGMLLPDLKKKIAELSLTQDVDLVGAQEPIEVARAYREADIFWFTGIVDEDGDRDGLPNVIPEAMAHGIPVISSQIPGAMEAVIDGKTGLVVDVSSPKKMADSTARLINDKDAVLKLTKNARDWVEKNFVASHNTATLAAAMKKACQL